MKNDSCAVCAIDAINPCLRLAAAFLLGVCAAIMQRLPACLASLALGLSLVFLSCPDWPLFLRRAAAVNTFALLLWLILPFTAGAPFYAHCWILGVSREGIRLAALSTLKANAVYCLFAAFCGRMTAADFASALKSLHVSDRLTLLFLFMGRAFHILRAQWRDLEQAARLRGFEAGFSRHTWNTLGALLALLLIRSHERARRMHEAMLLRGYDGKISFNGPAGFSTGDLLFALALAASLAGMCCMEWGNGSG